MTTHLSLIEKLRLAHVTTGQKMFEEAAERIEELEGIIGAYRVMVKQRDERIAELEAWIDKNDEWAKWFIEKTDARIAELEKEIERVDEWAKGYIEKADTHIAELEAALKLMIDTQDDWEKGVYEVVGKQPNVFNRAIDAARKVLGENE